MLAAMPIARNDSSEDRVVGNDVLDGQDQQGRPEKGAPPFILPGAFNLKKPC